MTNYTIASFIVAGIIIFIIGGIIGYALGCNNRKNINNYMYGNVEAQKQLGEVVHSMNDFLNTLCDSHINHTAFCIEKMEKIEQAINELKNKKEEKHNYAIFDDD